MNVKDTYMLYTMQKNRVAALPVSGRERLPPFPERESGRYRFCGWRRAFFFCFDKNITDTIPVSDSCLVDVYYSGGFFGI